MSGNIRLLAFLLTPFRRKKMVQILKNTLKRLLISQNRRPNENANEVIVHSIPFFHKSFNVGGINLSAVAFLQLFFSLIRPSLTSIVRQTVSISFPLILQL